MVLGDRFVPRNILQFTEMSTLKTHVPEYAVILSNKIPWCIEFYNLDGSKSPTNAAYIGKTYPSLVQNDQTVIINHCVQTVGD